MIIEFQESKSEIDPSCYVSGNSTIVGKVKLKSNSSVWYGAVIRGDGNFVSIGENTNIQENSTMKMIK